MAPRGQLAYGASKAALNGMLTPMARDLGKYGIRVLSLMPAMFVTPMSKPYLHKDEHLKKVNPLHRVGQPHEFGNIVKTCIENSYLNGVEVNIDGGEIVPL